MADLSAPQVDDLGPGAVLGPAAMPYVFNASIALPAPPDVISALYNVQVAPGSMSFG